MRKIASAIVLLLLVAGLILTETGNATSSGPSYYFPPPGEGLSVQNQKTPTEVGLDEDIIDALSGKADRWALWRHGYLVHVEGDFNQTAEVRSLRKTWHAVTVGAAQLQGKISDFQTEKLSIYQTGLTGNDADATWRHVITQSAGFDYPGCGYTTDFLPGEMWTYSDLHLKELNEALFKAWGSPGGTYNSTNYGTVLGEAYFDAIGMQGWYAKLVEDGIRLTLDLEDMGRLGLLVLARGSWNGQELIPQSFIEELETKQTAGMLVNYNGCNDGVMPWDASDFPESPYGYLTWVNKESDFYPGADTHWAFGRGTGGYYMLWNKNNGIVYAAAGLTDEAGYNPTSNGVPHIIEANVVGPNPLAEGEDPTPTSSPVISATPRQPPGSTPTSTPTLPGPTPTPTKTPTPTLPGPTSTPTPTATPTTSGPTPTPTPTSTVTPPLAPSSTIHVGNLEGAWYKLAGSWSAEVEVTVENGNHQPVANVYVAGQWSSGIPALSICLTNIYGKCTVSVSGLARTAGAVSYTVADLSLGESKYTPENNHDLDFDSDGTTYTVYR